MADPTDNGIVWEDPEEYRRRVNWMETLRPLMAYPGRWARVADMAPRSAGTITSQLRKGQRSQPVGRWEFTSRTEGGHGYVYARYLGPEDGA